MIYATTTVHIKFLLVMGLHGFIILPAVVCCVHTHTFPPNSILNDFITFYCRFKRLIYVFVRVGLSTKILVYPIAFCLSFHFSKKIDCCIGNALVVFFSSFQVVEEWAKGV